MQAKMDLPKATWMVLLEKMKADYRAEKERADGLASELQNKLVKIEKLEGKLKKQKAKEHDKTLALEKSLEAEKERYKSLAQDAIKAKDLTDQLDALKEENRQLMNKIADVEKVKWTLERKTEQTMQQYRSMEKELEQNSKEIRMLKRELDDREHRISNMQAKLEQTQRQPAPSMQADYGRPPSLGVNWSTASEVSMDNLKDLGISEEDLKMQQQLFEHLNQNKLPVNLGQSGLQDEQSPEVQEMLLRQYSSRNRNLTMDED